MIYFENANLLAVHEDCFSYVVGVVASDNMVDCEYGASSVESLASEHATESAFFIAVQVVR
jgi:hypothetical protein